VDDINEFVAGFGLVLKDDGIVEFEFPYLRDLVESCAFDTIYHEHVFYYSLTALEPLFQRHGLHLNDVVHLGIHGGSLRLTASRHPGKTDRLKELQVDEEQLGMGTLSYYEAFGGRVNGVKQALRDLILGAKARGKRIAAYGAAAKGATLLNFVGIDHKVINYVVDRNRHKVGKYMPGVKIPIRAVDDLRESPPDLLLVLAWNFAEEIMRQLADYGLDGHFVIPVPTPQIVPAPMRVTQSATEVAAGAPIAAMWPIPSSEPFGNAPLN
jgi:hypothetical protein